VEVAQSLTESANHLCRECTKSWVKIPNRPEALFPISALRRFRPKSRHGISNDEDTLRSSVENSHDEAFSGTLWNGVLTVRIGTRLAVLLLL
jgi:hypothetical protein